MPKPTRGLLLALEELESSMPTNDTTSMIQPDPTNPQADGKEVEMKNLAGKEGTEKNTEADTLPENDTTAIVQKNPEDPNSDGKVVDLKVVETGKATESGISPIATEDGDKPMPKNDTSDLIQPAPENPHSTGEVKEVTLVEKGKATESGVDPIKTAEPSGEKKEEKGEIAQEASSEAPLKNDTDPTLEQNPENPHPDGKEVAMTLVEKGKETESGIQALEEAAAEISEGFDNVSQAEDVIDELEKYRDIVDGAAESGDMNYVAADILNTALENLRERVGLPSRPVISLEDNAGGIAKAKAGRVALEAINVDVGQIKEKIVGAIKALLAKMAEYFKNATSRTEMINKQVEKAKQAEQAVAQSTPKEPTFEDPSSAKMFTTKGQFTKNISGDIATSMKLVTDIAAAVTREVDRVVEQSQAVLAGKTIDSGATGDFLKPFADKVALGDYGLEMDQSERGLNVIFTSKTGAPASNQVPYLSAQDFNSLVSALGSVPAISKSINQSGVKVRDKMIDMVSIIEKMPQDGAGKDQLTKLSAQIRIFSTLLVQLVNYNVRLSGAGSTYLVRRMQAVGAM